MRLPVRRSFGWVVVGGLALGAACGGPQVLGREGDACVRAADCIAGFVCIEAQCSSDLSRLEGDSTGPGVGSPGGAGPGGSGAAAGGTTSASGGTVSTGGGTSPGGVAGAAP